MIVTGTSEDTHYVTIHTCQTIAKNRGGLCRNNVPDDERSVQRVVQDIAGNEGCGLLCVGFVRPMRLRAGLRDGMLGFGMDARRREK